MKSCAALPPSVAMTRQSLSPAWPACRLRALAVCKSWHERLSNLPLASLKLGRAPAGKYAWVAAAQPAVQRLAIEHPSPAEEEALRSTLCTLQPEVGGPEAGLLGRVGARGPASSAWARSRPPSHGALFVHEASLFLLPALTAGGR